MIHFKKSYAEQLFQLALALSLLRVNPDNYLGWGWQSQSALHNGDGWQLELLRPTPISDYPYANRKALIPLIDDLVRFDRYRNSTTGNNHDIQTYLLNIQNEQKTNEANQQANQSNDTATIQNHPENRTFPSDILTLNHPTDFDLFLNSDQFTESRSVFEQNLADLNDYADLLPYAGLPQKDEPPDMGLFSLDAIQNSNQNHFDDFASLDSGMDRDDSGYGSVIKWSELFESANVRTFAAGSDNDDDAISIKSEKLTSEGEKNSTSGVSSTVELTEEESEIVEILYKQDVDLGYSLEPFKVSDKPITAKHSSLSCSSNDTDDDTEKLKILEEIKNEKENVQKDLDDDWAGIQFTIDNETGEYIQLPLQLDDLLEDVLHVASLNPDDPLESIVTKSETDSLHTEQSEKEQSTDEIKIKTNQTNDLELAELELSADLSQIVLSGSDASELEEFEMMIQSAGPFQHPRSSQSYSHGSQTYRQPYHQSRVPLSRAVSMEQRLQDIAHLFNPIPTMGVGMGVGEVSSYPHYPTHHYSYQSPGPISQHHPQFTHPHSHAAVLHNASLAELGGASTQPHYGQNLASAVSSSMHITNAGHETDAAGGATGYKMDPDMMYYSNTSSELNHTTDGFINSILNDDDLQLMDMGVNESFYTMRMLEPNATSNNSSVLGGGSSAGVAAVTGAATAGASGGNHTLLGASMQTSLSGLGPTGSTGASGDRLDASSDSAVSSMGSERVPSLSDGEWGDAGSDSAQDYHHSYNSRLGGDSSRHPVAQKKHQMFGKRYFQEQSTVPPPPTTTTTIPPHAAVAGAPHSVDVPPIKYEYEPPYGMQHHHHHHHHHHHASTGLANNLDGAGTTNATMMNKHSLGQPEIKYSCSLDFQRQSRGLHEIVSHNHTYTMPQSVSGGASPRPQQIRDKKQRRADEEHLSRDEKRARGLNIPISVSDIINLPMDEFNERLSKYDLSESQLSLIRDIRRRGKNKVAAQNCRKRKLDQINHLADEVVEVKKTQERLKQDLQMALLARKNIMYKFSMLHKHVFQNLRDPDGNPYSQSQYSLQQSADGSIFLLPKDNKETSVNGGGGGGGNSNGNGPSNHDSSDNNTTIHHVHHPHHNHHHQHQHQQQHQPQQQQQQQQQQHHSQHPHSHQHQQQQQQHHQHHPHHQKD